jgi:membrane protein insertase Oxa1/YidC/SpoIIIJ
MMTSKSTGGGGDKGDFSQIMQKQMLYFFPIITFFILLRLPSAIALYWLTTALFSVGQQYLAFKEK